MKKLCICIFSILLMSFSTNAQPGWFWQNPYPTNEYINAVFFISAAEGWAVGNNGTIIYTLDGGEHWSLQVSNTDADLNDLYFASPTSGIIVGDNGSILRTNNSGNSWIIENSSVGWDINSLHFFTDTRRWN